MTDIRLYLSFLRLPSLLISLEEKNRGVLRRVENFIKIGFNCDFIQKVSEMDVSVWVLKWFFVE